MSLTITVTRFACKAHKLASSKRRQRYASVASWSARSADDCILNLLPTCKASLISLTNLCVFNKVSVSIKIWVSFWTVQKVLWETVSLSTFGIFLYPVEQQFQVYIGVAFSHLHFSTIVKFFSLTQHCVSALYLPYKNKIDKENGILLSIIQ